MQNSYLFKKAFFYDYKYTELRCFEPNSNVEVCAFTHAFTNNNKFPVHKVEEMMNLISAKLKERWGILFTLFTMIPDKVKESINK